MKTSLWFFIILGILIIILLYFFEIIFLQPEIKDEELLQGGNCQTNFKMAYIYIYEPENHKPENLKRLENEKKLFEEIYNKAGKYKTTINISLPIYTVEINSSNRAEFIYSDQYNPIPHIKFQELMQHYYETHADDIDLVVFLIIFLHLRKQDLQDTLL